MVIGFLLEPEQVTCLEDFFGEEVVFLVCPNDRVRTNDFELNSEG